MTLTHNSRRPSVAALAPGRLGVAAAVFFVLSGAAPLTVVAGIVPAGYAATGVTGIPLAFLVVGGVLLLFSQGYVAMAERVSNAGAFYSYIAQGLGRPAGIAAAWVALLSYNGLQVALYGAIGAATAPLVQDWTGVRPRWWAVALICWAVVAVLGVWRVEVSGRVLAVLLLAEIAAVTVFSAANVLDPAGGAVSFTTLSPGNLFVAGGAAVGAILAVGVLGFVGFESGAVLREELRTPWRTISLATTIAVVVIAVLYGFAAWAMSVATGPDRIVATSTTQGPETLFVLAGDRLGGWAITVGHALFATSLVAAMIAVHHIVARYMFVLGREHVLPAALGRTWARTSAPRAASLTQSGIGVTVIVVWALAGWSPMLHLFYWCGTSGGLGVLLLLTVTSVAVLRFFAVDDRGETLWRRLIAPAMSALALGGIAVLAFCNLPGLLGVGPGHPMLIIVPALFAVAAAGGLGFGWYLRAVRPRVYARLAGRHEPGPEVSAGRDHVSGQGVEVVRSQVLR